jgi:ketosteroid isomerase-like protein
MTAPTPIEIVEAMHAAFRRRDLDDIARHWADDVVYEAPGVSLAGKEARIAAEHVWLDAFTEGDVFVKAHYVAGDEIVVIGEMVGLHSGPLAVPGGATIPATGRRIEGPYVARYRIRDGRVASQTVIYDRLALLHQLCLG